MHNTVSTLNKEINTFLNFINPDWVFLPFPDRHIDHRTVFDAAVVCCRPNNKNFPRTVLAYETLSETHWNVPGIEPAFYSELFYKYNKIHRTKKRSPKFLSVADKKIM